MLAKTSDKSPHFPPGGVAHDSHAANHLNPPPRLSPASCDTRHLSQNWSHHFTATSVCCQGNGRVPCACVRLCYHGTCALRRVCFKCLHRRSESERRSWSLSGVHSGSFFFFSLSSLRRQTAVGPVFMKRFSAK